MYQDIDRDIINRVIHQESRGNPNAVSPKGAQGVMQIMPETARNPGFGVTPLQGWDGVNPMTAPVEEQIRFGTDYLNAMAKQHGGDVRLALAAYNAGPGAVAAAGGIPNFKETQNYVDTIAPQEGTQMASAGDWRSRSMRIDENPAAAAAEQAPVAQPAVSDWRTRAQPLQITPTPALAQQPVPAVGDWRARAQPIKTRPEDLPGNDSGAGVAALQGFNSAVPFGERITAGLGAVGAKVYDKLSGENVTDGQSVGDLYNQARQDQEKTAAMHSGAYTLGSVGGLAATLPLLSTKVLTGARATTGVRGSINAIPEALGAVGNFVRGSKVAEGAGTAAKLANLTGKAVRSAAVATPTGALYGYGNSRSDLNSQGAVDDAVTGAKFSAALGAAVPIAGAALSKIPKPNVSQAVKDLAAAAKDRFGIDLALDQIAPSGVRDTVQKISQKIPFSGVDNFLDRQQGQWMRAVTKTLGEDADSLTPEVVTNYLKRAGDDFEAPLRGKIITFSQKDINALGDITASAKKKVASNLAEVVQSNVKDVLDNLSQFKVGNGGIREVPGERLASLRSQLLQDLPSIEGGARQQVAKIIDRIDEVVDRHLSPSEVKQLSTARLQWRNFRTLEPLLEKSPDGMINPTQLMQKVASSKYIKAARKKIGEDDLVDLAKIGKQFMAKKGGSDTAEKLAYLKGATDIGTGAGALAFPTKVIPAVLANTAYQKLLNQSPKVVERLVKDTAGSGNAATISALLGAQAAPVGITKTP